MTMLPLGTVWGVAIRMHMAFPLWIAAGIAFGYGRLLGVLLCVLCVHEAAHAWMAAALGLRVCSLELMPFGGVARIEGMLTLRPLQEVLIALAGPCSNLLMAMGAALGVYLFHIPGKTVQTFIRCNFMLMACNLLPALPLDGGRALRALLQPLFGRRTPTRILSSMGMALSCLLFGIGLWGVTQGLINLTFFMAAAYLGYAAAQARHTVTATYVQSLSQHAKALHEARHLPVRWIAVHASLSVEQTAAFFMPRYYHMILAFDEADRTRYEILAEWQLLDALLKDPAQRVQALCDATRKK